MTKKKKDTNEIPIDNILHIACVLLIRAQANEEEILLYPSPARFWYMSENITFSTGALVIYLWSDRHS